MFLSLSYLSVVHVSRAGQAAHSVLSFKVRQSSKEKLVLHYRVITLQHFRIAQRNMIIPTLFNGDGEEMYNTMYIYYIVNM